jgi:hypothetical protein
MSKGVQLQPRPAAAGPHNLDHKLSMFTINDNIAGKKTPKKHQIGSQ